MGTVWETGAIQGQAGQASILNTLTDEMSTLNPQLDQSNLRSIAQELLQKEFLAIRMVAYRMYEQYMKHEHPQYPEEAE